MYVSLSILMLSSDQLLNPNHIDVVPIASAHHIFIIFDFKRNFPQKGEENL